MISSLHLNKLIFFIFFFIIAFFDCSFSEEEPVDIWKKKETQNEQNIQIDEKEDSDIESPILSKDESKIVEQIDENEIGKNTETVIGIFGLSQRWGIVQIHIQK